MSLLSFSYNYGQFSYHRECDASKDTLNLPLSTFEGNVEALQQTNIIYSKKEKKKQIGKLTMLACIPNPTSQEKPESQQTTHAW